MNILTFDIEEWYHIRFDDAFLNDSILLKSLEKRLDYNINLILDLLDKHNVRATFFCLGEVARNSPGVIKRINDRGHDIGCHSNNHRLVTSMSEHEFSIDLYTALECIQSEIGRKVYMYRAPAFSITNDNMWAFDIMIDHGITIDSSIFPASRDYGGISNINLLTPKKIITSSGGSIKEFPMSVHSIFGKNTVFTGGGYFRLWPYPIIKRVMGQENYTMSYFHPRDFDHKQPILDGLSLTRKFKSYYGLKKTLYKLDLFLNDFDFLSISEADQLLNWNDLNE
jgi:peptidoglycan-N-acetylglucosamine deacetylase